MHTAKMQNLKKLGLAFLTSSVLAQDSLDITLSWDMPVTFEDGTPLLMCQEYGQPTWPCLDFYSIYYGRATGEYDNIEIVSDERLLERELTLPEQGRWYFAITSSTNTELESAFSDEVSLVLGYENAKPNIGYINYVTCGGCR